MIKKWKCHTSTTWI